MVATGTVGEDSAQTEEDLSVVVSVEDVVASEATNWREIANCLLVSVAFEG